jgi:hypothetical protein
MEVNVYAQSYMSILDMLFLYRNAMLTTPNEIIYKVKNSCYTVSSKSYLSYDMLNIFRFSP